MRTWELLFAMRETVVTKTVELIPPCFFMGCHKLNVRVYENFVYVVMFYDMLILVFCFCTDSGSNCLSSGFNWCENNKVILYFSYVELVFIDRWSLAILKGEKMVFVIQILLNNDIIHCIILLETFFLYYTYNIIYVTAR